MRVSCRKLKSVPVEKFLGERRKEPEPHFAPSSSATLAFSTPLLLNTSHLHTPTTNDASSRPSSFSTLLSPISAASPPSQAKTQHADTGGGGQGPSLASVTRQVLRNVPRAPGQKTRPVVPLCDITYTLDFPSKLCLVDFFCSFVVVDVATDVLTESCVLPPASLSGRIPSTD
ncbi:hypothetical protein M011DRAFT_155147 [Sporormia fimetaria CBS 119925]|uniref:Uncharacterized protein n=1 Tax=Sporormia fimetaria CBS 119925 TaxID=1340428 RepID=A0A6A6V751_9PLEO|nr:hypothetical protein M011DRAFT_155147 [Sporormia fimetaria CBS 119925]